MTASLDACLHVLRALGSGLRAEWLGAYVSRALRSVVLCRLEPLVDYGGEHGSPKISEREREHEREREREKEKKGARVLRTEAPM